MNRELNNKEQEIFHSLKAVVDPELMVNIIDLGLVYDVRIHEPEKKIEIDLTLTSPGCPMGEVIMEDARQLVASNNPDSEISINLVWEPAWTLERLTDEGKQALGRI